mgnify:CR=1 FL=1
MIAILLTNVDEPDDREFLTDMFFEFSRLMYNTAGKYSESSFEKEDIVQEALVRLIPKVSTLRTLSRRALVSYIAVTVKHTAINYLHKVRAGDARLLDLSDSDADDLASDNVSMDERVILSDELGKLSKVWPRLKEAERLLLEGKYICGYTDAELAETLGCKESSVRMKLTRARRHALTLLTEEGVTVE